MANKKEIWKLITFKGKKPGMPYAVSNHGRFGVMLDKKGNVDVRKIKAGDNGHRYNYKINGQSKALFVHKEVANAFVRKPSPKHNMVIRKDHDYLNNSADNLKWATTKEHKEHVTFSPNSVKARRKKAIIVSSTAKVFDERTALEVKKLIWDPKRKITFKQIAKKYKVSEMQIYRIKSGELWFHVKAANEPENKKYKLNLQNIALQAKKETGKKNAAKRSKK